MTRKNADFNYNAGMISGSPALGRHVTIEYNDCGSDKLIDTEYLEEVFLKAARESGATVVSSSFHAFNPQGISGVIIIAESHFTVHAWPEHNYAAVDIFTCGKNIDLEKAIHSLEVSLEAKNVTVSSDRNRGFIENRTMKNIHETRSPAEYSTLWREEYDAREPWGILSSIDIYECDPDIIRNADSIRRFVYELCDRIKMKRFGECTIVNFGKDERVAGFSMTQLIETSLISGHFANLTHSVYLDIFSCRFYDPRDVAEFALSYFKGSNYKLQLTLRQ